MNQYLIRENGEIVHQTITENPINILPSIAQAFQTSVQFKFENILDLALCGEPDCGHVTICGNSGNRSINYWSIGIKKLTLNTSFTLYGDVLSPDFNSQGKLMSVPWTPRPDMFVVLGIVTTRKDSGDYVAGKHYLIAYDSGSRVYRLPLSNLYDHLELCHGQSPGVHPTELAAILDAVKRFRASQWNSDLFHSFQQENAPKMFRFKPTNDGFEQMLHTGDDWTKLCQKVSNSIIADNFSLV